MHTSSAYAGRPKRNPNLKLDTTMPKAKTPVPATAPAVAAPPASSSTPASAGLRKVSLAGFAVQSPVGKSAKSYPLLPDPDGQVSELVGAILEQSAQLEALDGSVELLKAELIAIAKSFYFQHFTGQHAIASSIEAHGEGGKVVRVGFSNSYRGTSDEAALVRLAGEHAARFFKQTFEIKIKGDLIPEAAVKPLLAELQDLFARHGASSALTAKATIKPNKEFHTARHTLFSPEQNQELDKVVPVSASVKTKLGRGGGDDE
jgi:hypothetical protein